VIKNQAAPAVVLFSASDDRHRVEPFRALIFFRCLSDPRLRVQTDSLSAMSHYSIISSVFIILPPPLEKESLVTLGELFIANYPRTISALAR
jgi:hypothetical protein